MQQIQNMKVAIESANESWTKFKVSAQNALQSDLANWLGSGINQAKSLGDAFQQLGLSAVKSIQQIAAQMVAQIAISKMIQAIQSVTGWGSGGSSGTGGVANVATSAAAGMAQAAPLMAASEMMTAAGAIISSGAIELGVSAGELMTAAMMLQVANDSSMGMGFASGGYVSGPGSSAWSRRSGGQSGIPARRQRRQGLHEAGAGVSRELPLRRMCPERPCSAPSPSMAGFGPTTGRKYPP